jgi:DNA (cytosine-5)-methyltransferase 1
LAQLKDKDISKLDTLSIKKVGNVNPSGNGMNGNVFHEEGLSPTITTNKGEGNKILMEEPNVLSPKRTEYGKQIRKKYEAGLIDEKIGNMRTFEPRTDGMCNTLTTVLKDNLLCVPCVTSANECECIGRLENVNGHDFLKRVYSADSCSPTITTVTGGGHEVKILEDIHKTNNRIRKLTEIECIKLMGFTVEDAIKMKNADVSNSKIYHCAGNSIVVPLLEKLFANLLQLNN